MNLYCLILVNHVFILTFDDKMSSFYRTLPIGIALISAVNEMIGENIITPQQGATILEIFDELIQQEMTSTYYRGQALIGNVTNGDVDSYNTISSKWSIESSNVNLLIGTILLHIPKARFTFS